LNRYRFTFKKREGERRGEERVGGVDVSAQPLTNAFFIVGLEYRDDS
jgi:hypothetical protein